MPESVCDNCGHTFHWRWEEAFDKFGFKDGDGQCETYTVADALAVAGYNVEILTWGIHNTIIHSIVKDGAEQIPSTASVGYDEPRDYLPAEILRLLDDELGG